MTNKDISRLTSKVLELIDRLEDSKNTDDLAKFYKIDKEFYIEVNCDRDPFGCATTFYVTVCKNGYAVESITIDAQADDLTFRYDVEYVLNVGIPERVSLDMKYMGQVFLNSTFQNRYGRLVG